jgi:hypothetical protein
VDREHFSNLFDLAVSSIPAMSKQTFAQACKEALKEKSDKTVQMRKDGLLL